MRASTAALCIGLLIAALTPVDALVGGEPLRDLSATYAHKVGQAYQSEVSLLQYTVDFADELHTLEFVDCANKSYCPAVNTAQCAPCDYSDATSPSCGTSPRVPRGMNCSCPFRDALCYTPDPYFLHRGSLVLNQPLHIDAQAQGIVLLGVYIPEGFCQAVRVRVVSVNTNNVVSLGVRPDWSVASTGQQEALAFTPSSSSFPPRWTSQRSYSPYVTYCPSDYTSFRSAGTWFVAINLANNFINATVLAEHLPLPDGPTPPFVPLPQYPDYNVLRTDNLYTVTPGSDTTKFVIGVTGPCPRFVGVSVAGFPYVLSRVYTTLGISLTNPDPLNSAGVDSWVDGDWSSVIAISFCPNDTSAVSVVNIGVQANTLFLLALYVTTNPQRFFARPVLSTTIAPTAYSVADTLFHAVALQCSSADGPVTFRPCTVSYGAGLSHCAPSLSMNAPLAVAAPTWPPFPYIVRGLYNSPPADLNESFIPARLSFSLAYSVRQMSSLGLMDMRALTRLDFGSCAVYLHPNIVTKERRARSTTDPIRGLRPVQGQCEHDRFMKLSSEIINILNLISPLIPPLQRTQYSIDLDYLHFTDDWQNCVALAESLLTIDEISLPQMTTTCTEFSRDSLDPCCSFEGLWATGFCAPRTRATPQTLYQLNAEASDRCPGGDCLSTYLQDYITAAQSSCVVVNLAPISYSNNVLLPFAECQEELLFGLGTPCIHDSDCAFGFCDYAAGTCVQPLENLYSTFVDCVLTRSDPGLVFQLQTVVLQLSADLPPAELKSAVLRAFLEWDCVEPFFLSPKQAHSRLIQDVSFVTDVICPLEFVLTVHATIYPLCSDHAGVSYGSDSTPQFSCPTQPACDWNPFVTNASLCSRSPPHCYYCFTSDYCLPILGVSSQAQCEQQAIGCQLRDGSLAFVSGASLDALAAECANASTCSFCTLPGGCDTSAECLSPQNGYCTDGTDFYHYEGNATVPGACVLPIDWNSDCSMWHDTINLTNPLIPAQSVLLARPIGCISRSITTPKKCASFTRVSTLSGLLLQPTWHMPATTAAECAAHGRACVSPTMVDFLSQPLGYLTVQFVRPPLLNGTQFQDQMCGDLEVTSYYTWMSALWEGGVVRNLRWQAPRMQQDYFYQRSFIVENFAIAMTHAAYSLYTLNLLSADQCRFNRRIMALEAVSCACGAANSSCLDAVPTLPSASGFVCSTAQRFAAPPLSFTFYAADLHGCTPVTMFHVSPLNFGSLAPPQALSTYWTKPSHEFAGLTFSNELGAAVGEVVGTGFLLNSTSTLAKFSAWVCFPTPNVTVRSEFSVPDLAISPPTRATVTPQGLTVQIFAANSSWCVLVPALQTNVSYVPVMRAPDWQTRHPGSMSHKNRVALRVVSGFYFAGLAIAVLALVTVVTVHRLAGVMQVAFWLAILLGGACCIRGVYFLLLARGTVGDSTWGSVALMELPTFLLFSATTLVVLFWIVLADVKTQKKIGRVFMTAFLISNAAMYLLFMGFVVLFDRLGDRVTERCQGRLPTEVDHSRKRAVFLAYQSFIAVVAVLLAAAFVYGGIRLWVMLRSIQNTVSESEVITRLQITHCITAISIAVAFAGHAVFLFAVGVAVPGEPRLAAILMLLEVLPAAVILLRFVAQQGARLRSEGKASEETTYTQVMEEDTADF